MGKIAGLVRSASKHVLLRGVSIENGVYIWGGDHFIRKSVSTEEELFGKAGYYLIYFHNNLCPSCRRFYPLFEDVLKSAGGELIDIFHVRVVCDWFTSRCTDHAAKRLFVMFNVTATPKLLLVKVDPNGSRLVISDIIEDLGASLSRQESFSRALINLIRKNVSGTNT